MFVGIVNKTFVKVTSVFIGILLSVSISAHAQTNPYQGFPSLIWPKLYTVTYQKLPDGSPDYEKPTFNAEIRKLHGKKIVLPGYIVPFEKGMKSDHFTLSSLPLNACFFCGVGGPETVVEVFTTSTINYTDKPVEIEGILKINESDPDKLIFILEQATLAGEIDY